MQEPEVVDPTASPEMAFQKLTECLEKGDIAAAHAIQRRFWQADHALPGVDYLRSPALLNWATGFEPAPEGEFVFVSGTPRSSTTALGNLLRLHPDVSLFIELFSVGTGYVPQMFAPANIRRLQERDLLKLPIKAENAALIEAGKVGRIVGDKRPNFMKTAAFTLRAFEGHRVTVLHLVREIKEVAASYLRRAAAGTFPARYDHRLAVEHMNMNTRNALEVSERIGSGHRLIVLDYATFWSELRNGRRLMRELGLAPKQMDQNRLKKMFDRSQQLLDRERSLPDEALAYIEEHFDRASFDKLRALAFA